MRVVSGWLSVQRDAGHPGRKTGGRAVFQPRAIRRWAPLCMRAYCSAAGGPPQTRRGLGRPVPVLGFHCFGVAADVVTCIRQTRPIRPRRTPSGPVAAGTRGPCAELIDCIEDVGHRGALEAERGPDQGGVPAFRRVASPVALPPGPNSLLKRGVSRPLREPLAGTTVQTLPDSSGHLQAWFPQVTRMSQRGELGVFLAVFRLTSEMPVVRTHLRPPSFRS